MNKDNTIINIFLKEFNVFANNSYEQLLKNTEFLKDEQLYHYTSLLSLQKIIESQALRATSIYMLNDPNELFHGREQIIDWYINNKELKKRLKIEPDFSYIRFPAFIFSLTELDDDMYFWDKYGDKHKGIRIGFTPKKLIEYWRKLENTKVILVPVIYQDYSKKFIGDYANCFLKFKKKISDKINNIRSNRDLLDYEIKDLHYINSIIATLIKRKEWAQEKEWRIICIPNGYVNENIVGDFSTGNSVARVENATSDTLALLVNPEHDGAKKEILKVGSLAGNIEYIRYTLQLLLKRKANENYFNDIISKSLIDIR